MFLKGLSNYLQDQYTRSTSPQITLTFFCALTTLVLILFRLWKFTIRPLLHPNEPRELPYWIPYFGHTFAYVRSGHDVIVRAREYFKNTREPFALQLKDRKMYFILHPDDSTAAYKNTSSMVFIKIIEQLQYTFRISEKTLRACWAVPRSKEEDKMQMIAGVPNPSLKSLGELNMDFWRIQVAGKEYKAIEARFSRCIEEELANEVAEARLQGGELNLIPLIQRVFLAAGFRAFFGEKLLEIDPDFVKTFVAFDNESWKLWFKWPFSKTMFANKEKLEKSLEKWLAIPREDRGETSFLVDIVERTQNIMGAPMDDMGRIMNLLIFIINTNTYKAAYWATVHILLNPTILADVQSEVGQGQELLNSAQPSDSYFNYLRLETPQISANLNESLRCYSASSSIRLTVDPVRIGDRIIPEKSVVFIPFRPLHYDAEVFGPDTDSYNPYRFLNDKSLSTSQNFKPFSGGSSYCPGRVLAKMEFAAFISSLLSKYDVVVLGQGKIPGLGAKTPTKGIMMPTKGEDIRLRLSNKKA